MTLYSCTVHWGLTNHEVETMIADNLVEALRARVEAELVRTKQADHHVRLELSTPTRNLLATVQLEADNRDAVRREIVRIFQVAKEGLGLPLWQIRSIAPEAVAATPSS